MCGGLQRTAPTHPGRSPSTQSTTHHHSPASSITHLKVVRLLSVRDCGALRASSRWSRELVDSMVEEVQVGS